MLSYSRTDSPSVSLSIRSSNELAQRLGKHHFAHHALCQSRATTGEIMYKDQHQHETRFFIYILVQFLNRFKQSLVRTDNFQPCYNDFVFLTMKLKHIFLRSLDAFHFSEL